MADDAGRVLPGYEAVKRATQGNTRDIQKLRDEITALRRRLVEIDAELQRRRGGRPTHKGSEAA